MSDFTARLFRVAKVGEKYEFAGEDAMAKWIAGKKFVEFRLANPPNTNPAHRDMKRSNIKKYVRYLRALKLLNDRCHVDEKHAKKLKSDKTFAPWLLLLAETHLEPKFRRDMPRCKPAEVPGRIRSMAKELLDGPLHMVPSVGNIYGELRLPEKDTQQRQAFTNSLRVIAELSGEDFELKQEPVVRPRAKPRAKAAGKKGTKAA